MLQIWQSTDTMIVHLFNSSLVSGPETLVIPSLPHLSSAWQGTEVWNLEETRLAEAARLPLEYAKTFGLATRSFSVAKRFDRSAIMALADEIDRVRPSIVHAHDVKASIYLALAFLYLRLTHRKPKATRFVTTHHGIRGRFGLRIRLYEWIYRFVFLRFFDLVLTVCSSDGQLLSGSGVLEKNKRTHLNGVNRAKIENKDFDAQQKSIREKWSKRFGIDLSHRLVFGVAGRLSTEKNHRFLLESLSQFARETSKPWVCICFGSGVLERSLKQAALELGLEKLVLFVGYQPNLGDELVGLDLLLSLSRAEGLPINLIEAGWSSVPVLATAVDGVNDLIPENDEILNQCRLSARPSVPEFVRKLHQFSNSELLRRQVGTAFQQRVEATFSGSNWINCLEGLYRFRDEKDAK